MQQQHRQEEQQQQHSAPLGWNLPFPPYPIQSDLMAAITSSLDHAHCGVFESPTGTGKSLSLICSVVPWLLANPISSPPSSATAEPDWVRLHLVESAQREAARRFELKQQRDQRFLVQSKRPLVVEEPKRRRRSDSSSSLSSASSSASAKQRDEEVAVFSKLRKIYYCSRTHSQLTQFLHEMKRVFGNSVSTVALASRKQLCVNDALPHNERLNEACIDLQDKGGCSFIKNERGAHMLQDAALSEIHDIEDLVQRAKTVHACAYYSSRDALQSAQVVVLPYSMLLHESTRAFLNIELEGHVVVCDEAHNVMDAIADMHACMITRKQVEQAEAELQLYLSKYKSRFDLDNAQTLLELASVARKLANFSVKETQDKVWTLDAFFSACGLGDNNLFDLVSSARQARLANKLKGIAKELARTSAQTHASPSTSVAASSEALVAVADSTMQRLLQFLEALNSKAEDGRVHACPSPPQLKFLLLNPGSRFAKVVEKAHSVMLVGGTMHPVDDIVQQLFGSLPRNRVDLFSCGHVIPDNNLIAIACRVGAGNKELVLTYEARKELGVLDDIAKSIESLCAVVPAGLVVFFPSYSFEDAVATRMVETGAWSRLLGLKPVYREKATHNVLEAYAQSITEDSRRGAVLFAVVGGKLSEGINFSDQLARCVCVVGLPYPSKADAELSARMTYLGAAAGSRYYENLCWRGVNQSIGRAIRHQRDYAAIVLLDTRYTSTASRASLPKWIGQRYRIADTWSQTTQHVAEFFNVQR